MTEPDIAAHPSARTGWTSGQSAVPALDGLRAVAIALVVMVHLAFELSTQTGSGRVRSQLRSADPVIALGGTGVHLFFVLSAFLLFTPYARAIAGGQAWPSTQDFYRRRAARILPAYLMVLVLGTALFERTFFAGGKLHHWLLHLGFVHNWSHETYKSMNGPLWTIAVEVQFYVVVPLLAVLVQRWLRRPERWWLVPMAMSITALAGQAARGVIDHRHPWLVAHVTASALVDYLPAFGAGIGCALLCAAGSPAALRRAGAVGLIASAVITSWLMLRAALGIHTAAFDSHFFVELMAVSYAGLLLAVLHGPWGGLRTLLSQPWVRLVGTVSFSTYLWHYPVIQHVIVPIAIKVPNGAQIILGVALLVPLTAAMWLSWRLVEVPGRRWLSRLGKRRDETSRPTMSLR